MLADFLFLHGAPHPRGSILSLEVFQLKEVFRQHGFPLIQRLYICFVALCIPVQAPGGTVSLRQTRGADMPDATNPFASRLAGARIT